MTRDDFLDWRDRLRSGRLPRTVNRSVRAVTAGLNRAHSLGYVGNPASWRIDSLADDDQADTAIFLTSAQRKGLISAASPEAASFLRGLEYSGARPKELAAATTADFDGQRLTLSHRKGRPPKLRSRSVVLDKRGVEFINSQAKERSLTDLLFTAAEGKPWRRDMWAQEVRAAISEYNKTARGDARVPTGASAYSFRHARISELLQIYAVDPLTVAAQTGTSLLMIERTYFKFIRSAMLEKLASLDGERDRDGAVPRVGYGRSSELKGSPARAGWARRARTVRAALPGVAAWARAISIEETFNAQHQELWLRDPPRPCRRAR